MKKTLFILLFAMFTSSAVGLQAQEMDWGRVNIGADFSFQPTVFQFRSGLLSQHPERSIHLNAGYRLWDTNYIARDLLDGTDAHAAHYTPASKAQFLAYMEHQLASDAAHGLDPAALRDRFLRIYANPVK